MPLDLRMLANVKTFASLREFEAFLREHGVAKAAAAKLAKGGWPSLQPAGDPSLSLTEVPLTEVLAAIKQASLKIQGS